MIHVNKHLSSLMLVLLAGLSLAACSNKPAPWSADEPMQSEAQALDAETEQALGEEASVIIPTEVEDQGFIVEQPMQMMEEPAPMVGDLGSQPANYFAVQVVASGSRKQLTNFANQHQINDDWVAQIAVNGKNWHVLLLGVYPTRQEAEQALSSVQYLETRPWIRTVGSLQAHMN